MIKTQNLTKIFQTNEIENTALSDEIKFKIK